MNELREYPVRRVLILSFESVNAAHFVRTSHAISYNVPLPTADARETLRFIQLGFASKQCLLRSFARDPILKTSTAQARAHPVFRGPGAINPHRSKGNGTDD